MEWKTKFEQEMGLAKTARARGNEGQARVCARRAAGAVIRAYFQQHGLAAQGASAYDLLQDLLANPNVPELAHQAAGFLILRVSESFELPPGVDLLEAAQTLAESLMPGDITL